MVSDILEVKYAELAELIQEAKETRSFLPIKKDEKPFLEKMEQFDGRCDHHFFLYKNNFGKSVGFAVILPHQIDGVLSLGPIYVIKSEQGKGHGRKMVENIITWCSNRCVRSLATQTWGSNVKSQQLLESLGFEYVEEKKNTRTNGDSTVIYVLELNECKITQ